MKHKSLKLWRIIVYGLALLILTLACNFTGNSPSEPIPTPTGNGGGMVPPATESLNQCARLSGVLEMQVLVGPAEVVGLEPIAVGEIPFSVVSEGGINSVQGSGHILYQDVLEREWGTYTVSFEMDAEISGECVQEGGNAVLNVSLVVTGDQLVEVDAEGFQGDYPWSGTYTYNLSFPAEDGASMDGEGWAFILHLDD